MGTNYYFRHRVCASCERYDEHHIGKSSGGWTFSFRGDRRDEFGNVLGLVIESFADWKTVLPGGRIFDEYGDEHSLEDFLAMVELKRDEPSNHTTYCRREHPGHAARDCWLDDEGNSFSEAEFS